MSATDGISGAAKALHILGAGRMSSPGDRDQHSPTFDGHLARHAIKQAGQYQEDCRKRYDEMIRYLAELQARVAVLEAALADLTRRPNPTDRVPAP